jgi:hypothetical protein
VKLNKDQIQELIMALHYYADKDHWKYKCCQKDKGDEARNTLTKLGLWYENKVNKTKNNKRKGFKKF